MLDYLTHLRRESTLFASVIAATDPARPVPSCPGWTAGDLLWHLTEVQMFWGRVVADRLRDPAAAMDTATERPDAPEVALDLFRRESAHLIDALEHADDADEVWTWADDTTVGFVRRRQAHEAMIHRVDAEQAARAETPLDPGMAGDGIDELLRVYVGGVPAWADFIPDGTSIRVVATDPARVWQAAMGRMVGTSPDSGKSYDLPALREGDAEREPTTAITGSAIDLDLWMWGRRNAAGIGVAGDAALVDRLREVIAHSTQ